MIPPTRPVKHFALSRWAREQAVALELTTAEAVVLYVLVEHADQADCIARPSIATIAAQARLSPRTVSRALARLEELALVWSKQGGDGRAGRRELLCPLRRAETPPASPPDGGAGTERERASIATDDIQLRHLDGEGSAKNGLGVNHEASPKGSARHRPEAASPLGGEAAHPPERGIGSAPNEGGDLRRAGSTINALVDKLAPLDEAA